MEFNDSPFSNAAPDFDFDGLKVPPWIKYPNIPLGSIGWRMGAGEGYWDCFIDWWKLQLATTRLGVKTKYPEPEEWSDFYRGVEFFED